MNAFVLCHPLRGFGCLCGALLLYGGLTPPPDGKSPPPEAFAAHVPRIINRASSIAYRTYNIYYAHRTYYAHHHSSNKHKSLIGFCDGLQAHGKFIPRVSVNSLPVQFSSLTLLAFGARKPYLCPRGNGYPARIAVFRALRRAASPPYGKIGAVLPGNFPRAR